MNISLVLLLDCIFNERVNISFNCFMVNIDQDRTGPFEGPTPTESSGRSRFGIGSTSTRRPGRQKMG
ncbi:hypothetical protein NQ315_006159 [Exocentrus adspersus]|uniref:Uncharacterized protein n=1 Tax=Exocentrus adspersus TaxID=1586481 RepID=A0AAV8VZ53_9CUCU|nr:hypothetical protein NQ315_006159 [Exocentrus adspersus]